MTKAYVIKEILDFAQIPDDRLALCLKDFARVVPEIKELLAKDNSIGKHSPIEFKWADDGADDSVYLKDMPDEIDIVRAIEPQMIVHNLPMHGLKVITMPPYQEETGYSIEFFNRISLQKAQLPLDFAFGKTIVMAGNSVRGLHYQTEPLQTKLFMCLTGSVYLVAVHLAEWASTFGHHYALELRAGSGKAFLVPPGYAYGIATTGEESALISCLSTAEFNSATEGRILWCDQMLGIPWSFSHTPIVSALDMVAPSFEKFQLTNPFDEDNWQE